MDATLQDLKFAGRTLLKRPAFPSLVIATLALGIGAATAIFSIADAILLRPLPYPEPNRIVVFNETGPGGRMTLGWPNYLDFRDRATSFEATAAYQGTAFTVLVRRRRRPHRPAGRDRWCMARGDFDAEWDGRTRRGRIRQTLNPYSTDSVLRIVHSLLLSDERGFLLHASSILCDGRAYLFTGPSVRERRRWSGWLRPTPYC